MKISCIDKEVGKLLGESFFRIPRFQRPYSWDRVNVEDFWQDTVADSESQYFIGNFVVYDGKSAMGIVDGQQRITTITLLLCALRNALHKEGSANLANGIHSLIERKDLDDERLYVVQTESSYPYFQEHIQKFAEKPDVAPDVGPEEQLLKDAFEFLQSKVNDVVDKIKGLPNLSDKSKQVKVRQQLTEIRNKVLGLKLIYTSLENDEDAYLIFETLNTRGKDLTLSDLVKGHLTRLLKPKNKGVDVAKDKWSEINEVFEESQVDISVSTFIHHFWLSRYEYITEKKLYKKLRKTIKKEDAKGFLDELANESKIYRYIFESGYRKWTLEELAIRDSLSAMTAIFRIRQQLPMVLSVMRQYEDKTLKLKQVKAILSIIENFHFVFTAIASQRSSGGISFMYALAARDLYKAKSPSAKANCLGELYQKLKKRRPPFAEFESRFLDVRYSSKMTKQKALVKYILTKMYQAKSTGLPIDTSKATIEHLSPEKAGKSASALPPEIVASIGNLILVDEPLNTKLANKQFVDKVQILSEAKVWVDPVILGAKAWGAPEIEERARLLAKEAYNTVWKL
ncbi:MAG: DUF262 domain-containing HNH endonuclease family protein [Acidobacteriaceae bacterium]